MTRAMSSLRPAASRSETPRAPERPSERSTEKAPGERGGRRVELSPFRAFLDGRRPIRVEPQRHTEEKTPPRPRGDRRAHEGTDPRGEAHHEARAERPFERSSEPLSLEPFRVNAALLAPPPPAAAAARFDEAAFSLASELVESMRVGRFGKEGHAVSLRLRSSRGMLDVELREESGELRLSIEGASAAELEGLGARVRRELSARGLELAGFQVEGRELD